MNYASVVRVLSVSMLPVAGAALTCAVIAEFTGEPAQRTAFAVSSVGVIVLAASLLLLTPRPRAKARPSDALAVVVLWWCLMPLAAAPPFVLGIQNASLVGAVHDAASCLTGTGHSVALFGGAPVPESLIAWRALLHLLGAAATLVIVAGVFAAVNLGGPGIHRTILFSVPEGSFFAALGRVVLATLSFMGIVLVMSFAALLVAGASPQVAATLSVSALTTGVVIPGAPPPPLVQSVIAGAGLVAGALGFALWLPLQRGEVRRVLLDPEVSLFFALVILFALAAVPYASTIGQAAGWSLSALSTSGLALAPPTANPLPLAVQVLPALIGGSALAVAGGIKLARLVVLWQRAAQEFRQLGYRRSVLSFAFRDRAIDERSILGIWAFAVAYIFAILVLMTGFGVGGNGFEASLRLAVGGLTNSAGLLLPLAGDMSQYDQVLLTMAMILGRLEILTVLPLLSVSFWRG